jgi:transglutaminase-like putative cysteine protease
MTDPASGAAPRAPRTVPPAPQAAAKPADLRRLSVLHETVYDYDAPVELAHHLAYLRPRETPQQRVCGWQVQITPQPDSDVQAIAARTLIPGSSTSTDAHRSGAERAARLHGVHQSQDVWGNWRAGFFHARVHERLVVASSFTAELSQAPPLRAAASPAWERVAERLRYHPGSPHDDAIEFVLPSVYAPHDPALARFGREAFAPGMPLLAGALALMQLVHRRFEYRPAATSVATRAPEALAQRRGVCQDFAHVMIGAMRSLGLAARYVSGYLLTQPPPGQPRLVGADASHAWASVWCPVHGWVALDPTNAVPAGTDHVTLAWGRDYADVAPLRGVIRGGGRAVPRVAVTVEPVA